MGEVVETLLKKRGITNATILAMLGNTFSDGIGALAGTSVSSALVSHTAYDEGGDPIMELVGIVLGCLIPVALKFITMKSKKGRGTAFYISLLYIMIMMLGTSYMYFTGGKKTMTPTEKKE